jgi:hypothetical protein
VRGVKGALGAREGIGKIELTAGNEAVEATGGTKKVDGIGKGRIICITATRIRQHRCEVRVASEAPKAPTASSVLAVRGLFKTATPFAVIIKTTSAEQKGIEAGVQAIPGAPAAWGKRSGLRVSAWTPYPLAAAWYGAGYRQLGLLVSVGEDSGFSWPACF